MTKARRDKWADICEFKAWEREIAVSTIWRAASQNWLNESRTSTCCALGPMLLRNNTSRAGPERNHPQLEVSLVLINAYLC
jgi:hypothetical protein